MTCLPAMPRLVRRLLRAAPEQSGSGLIETALAMPIYLAVVVGVLQFSIVLFTYCNATYACRLASRYASIHSSSSLAPDTVAQIQGLVTSRLYLSSTITPTVSVNYYTPAMSAGSNIVGDLVGVSVTWNQPLKLSFINNTTFSISTSNYKIITR